MVLIVCVHCRALVKTEVRLRTSRGTLCDRGSAHTSSAHALNAERDVNNMDGQGGAARRPDAIHSIDIKGQRLRVAIRPGNGSGIPLLLVNGIGVGLEVFQPFIDELDPGTEVIRFDVPGTGGSPK